MLKHKDIYADDSRIAVKVPFTPEIRELHTNGYFPFVKDPRLKQETYFIGMFVLRPASQAWNTQITTNSHVSPINVPSWTFNIRGLDGGWMIANKNPMDAFRLALQYGIADAVIVGSTTAAKEGTPPENYVWHPYNPASWSQLKEIDPNILSKVMRQRQEFQKLDYLSERKFPAQIIVTQSGRESNPDILEAAIFNSKDLDGKPIEAYILTSKTGAKRIRERASRYNLNGRTIDDIIIELSPPENPASIDLQRLPSLLYAAPYNMKIVNHDGGAKVLSEFAKAGILPQMNLTLTRKKSLIEVLKENSDIDETTKQDILTNFEERTDLFFNTEDGSIPQELIPIHIIADDIDEAAVITFDSTGLAGKGFR